MVIVIENEEVESVPDNLEEFFTTYPTICQNNIALTDMNHVNMWRDHVLFIKQRQQATSDYRENPRVRWIGAYVKEAANKCVTSHFSFTQAQMRSPKITQRLEPIHLENVWDRTSTC